MSFEQTVGWHDKFLVSCPPSAPFPILDRPGWHCRVLAFSPSTVVCIWPVRFSSDVRRVIYSGPMFDPFRDASFGAEDRLVANLPPRSTGFGSEYSPVSTSGSCSNVSCFGARTCGSLLLRLRRELNICLPYFDFLAWRFGFVLVHDSMRLCSEPPSESQPSHPCQQWHRFCITFRSSSIHVKTHDRRIGTTYLLPPHTIRYVEPESCNLTINWSRHGRGR